VEAMHDAVNWMAKRRVGIGWIWKADIPSQRASHLGRPGSWWAIYVACVAGERLVNACACGGTIKIPLPSPGELVSPPCRLGNDCGGSIGDCACWWLYIRWRMSYRASTLVGGELEGGESR
jgi:hypothetical protein